MKPTEKTLSDLKYCMFCVHMRDKTTQEECHQSRLNQIYPYWCGKLGFGTNTLSLRCGGDDFERKP